MLQTIYEGNSCFSTERNYQRQRLVSQQDMRNVNDSVNMKPDVVMMSPPVSPLDLRTDVRLPGLGSGSESTLWDQEHLKVSGASETALWERQLQEELLLIQKQQLLQKQLLISEFQKQHDSLLRQHEAQLQEHLKLQQEMQTMRQQQEQLQREKQQEQQQQRAEQEEQQSQERREEQEALLHHNTLSTSLSSLRSRERNRADGAIASPQVKQRLQEFLLSKSTKDILPNGALPNGLSPKQWYIASRHTSLDQKSSLGDPLQPSLSLPQDGKDDFPLRKTASEPNLKVRSRLKQKVVERRSSPLLKKNEGTITTPFKKRALEYLDSKEIHASCPGPVSPNGAHSAAGTHNGHSTLPLISGTEMPSQPRLLGADGCVSVLSLYTSPSLPNIALGLTAATSPISAIPGGSGGSSVVRQGLPTKLMGPVPLPSAPVEYKASSQQALLQHLLQREQIRQQKMIISSGQCPASPQSLSPVDTKEQAGGAKLPRHHRPLNRTQSVPLPHDTLAQLVTRHQHFLDKQKFYQDHGSFSKLLSPSIEQARQVSMVHLEEAKEEQEQQQQQDDAEPQEKSVQLEQRPPSSGVIRKHSSTLNGTTCLTTSPRHHLTNCHSNPNIHSATAAHEVVKVKEEEGAISDDDDVGGDEEALPSRDDKPSAYQPEVKGRVVIRAAI
ncbi:histone deacetylase 9-B isoform X2 [Engraulis encrasicolus]|uniref:histone deacetylase 9-B isoform X2 n=1 Tax=Engraulis encrasicolus TaxID=184585 RepID=UPI002FD4CDE6